MNRIILVFAVLMFTAEELCLARTEDGETCQLNRGLEQQCGSYAHGVVKPLLNYFHQVRKELEGSEIKDREIMELKEKLASQERNISVIGEMRSQINRLTSNTKIAENLHKSRSELSEVTLKLQICELRLEHLNKYLMEKSKQISDQNRKIAELQTQLEKSESKRFENDKDLKLCLADVNTLNKTAQLNIPPNCIPHGYYPGIHKIKISGIDPIDVLCDSLLAGPGWIVIQQRIGGNQDFNRHWAEYREGFGSLFADFFLGLEKIHRLTTTQRHELYVHLVALNGTIFNARYDDFTISDEANGYTLGLGKFKGTIWDALNYSERRRFSTTDRDADAATSNCADNYKSGWWYGSCSDCNLNAEYGPELNWGRANQLKTVKMLIRPK